MMCRTHLSSIIPTVYNGGIRLSRELSESAVYIDTCHSYRWIETLSGERFQIGGVKKLTKFEWIVTKITDLTENLIEVTFIRHTDKTGTLIERYQSFNRKNLAAVHKTDRD